MIKDIGNILKDPRYRLEFALSIVFLIVALIGVLIQNLYLIICVLPALIELLIIIIILYQKNIEEIIQKPYPISQREARQSLDKLAPNAMHIRIIGRTLLQVLTNHGSYFLERLRNGARIELLLTHYELYQHMVAEIGADHLSDLSSALSTIIEIQNEIKRRNYEGQLEVRVIRYVPPLSSVAIDMDKQEAILIVELVLPYLEPRRRPNILLNPNSNIADEREWFKHFRYVIDMMWQQAQEIEDVKNFLGDLERYKRQKICRKICPKA
jgi:hypothetical protein